MAPIKPVTGAAAPAAKKAAAKRTQLNKLAERMGGAVRTVAIVQAHAKAWAAAVQASAPDLAASLRKLAEHCDPKRAKLDEAHEEVKALVEAAVTLPEVRVGNGATSFAVGEVVTAREGYLKWAAEHNLFTAKDADRLEVIRVTVDPRREDKRWVTCKSLTNPAIFIGPVESGKLKAV